MNAHIAIFIKPDDRIKADAMAHKNTDSFSVCVRIGPMAQAPGEVSFYADSLDLLLDLGYAIINQCRALRPAPPIETEPEHAPFTINDAVEHDEAMASMPDGYDPDQPITAAEAKATMQLLVDAVNKRP